MQYTVEIKAIREIKNELPIELDIQFTDGTHWDGYDYNPTIVEDEIRYKLEDLYSDPDSLWQQVDKDFKVIGFIKDVHSSWFIQLPKGGCFPSELSKFLYEAQLLSKMSRFYGNHLNILYSSTDFGTARQLLQKALNSLQKAQQGTLN